MKSASPQRKASEPRIEDVQGREDFRRIAIDKVGVRDISHPVRIVDRSQGLQSVVAKFDMAVDLAHDRKGTHMSRFVQMLNQHANEFSVPSFAVLLKNMAAHLESSRAYLRMSFPFFVKKRAPVSGLESLMDYRVALSGSYANGQAEVWLETAVPVTSLCPCSKQISEYGAHNQRSHVTIAVRTQAPVWIEELLELAESQASCEIFGVLKRPDEKYVTERAYDNPKFVEDLVRDVAAALDADERILAYSVQCENFESIHNHSAYAVIEREKNRGGN